MGDDMKGKAVRSLRLPTVNYTGTLMQTVQAQEGDSNSRFLCVTLFDDTGTVDLSGYEFAVLNATQPSGTIRFSDGEIKDGAVYCELTYPMLSETGRLECDIVLASKHGRLTTQRFYIHVLHSQANAPEIVLRDDNFPILVHVIRDVRELESTVSDAEAQRVFEEEVRIRNEATRTANESGRVSAEGTRSVAEAARQHAESQRKLNENHRILQENARIAAELQRNDAEAVRVTAESHRETVETARVSAENTRQQNEERRNTSEDARVIAENQRSCAEAERIFQEKNRALAEVLRIGAELDRIEAELDRQVGSVKLSEFLAKLQRLSDEGNMIPAGLKQINVSEDDPNGVWWQGNEPPFTLFISSKTHGLGNRVVAFLQANGVETYDSPHYDNEGNISIISYIKWSGRVLVAGGITEILHPLPYVQDVKWEGGNGSFSFKCPAVLHCKGTRPQVRTLDLTKRQYVDSAPRIQENGNITVFSYADVPTQLEVR